MRRFLITISLVMLLATASRMLIEIMTKTPAFNADLRVETVFGSEQVFLMHTMYDYPSYLLQVGSSFVRADLLPTADTEDFDDFASTETAMARAVEAVALLERSASKDPANALSWEGLAWGYAMTGDTSSAWEALRQSWQLAPYDLQLADLRLTLVSVLLLENATGISTSLTPMDRTAITRDLSTLSEFSPSTLEFHVEISALVGANSE